MLAAGRQRTVNGQNIGAGKGVGSKDGEPIDPDRWWEGCRGKLKERKDPGPGARRLPPTPPLTPLAASPSLA